MARAFIALGAATVALVLATIVPRLSAQQAGGHQHGHAEAGAIETMGHGHHATDPHMKLSPTRPAGAGDRERGDALVQTLRRVLEPYRDSRTGRAGRLSTVPSPTAAAAISLYELALRTPRHVQIRPREADVAALSTHGWKVRPERRHVYGGGPRDGRSARCARSVVHRPLARARQHLPTAAERKTRRLVATRVHGRDRDRGGMRGGRRPLSSADLRVDGARAPVRNGSGPHLGALSHRAIDIAYVTPDHVGGRGGASFAGGGARPALPGRAL